MIAALIIVFREVIEAGLVVGIVLAATRGVPSRGLWIGYGISGGVAGACVVAAFAGAIANAFAGSGQELFNAVILLVAVVMLAWHNVWMARHGRAIAAAVKAVGKAVAAGSRTMAALAIVVGIAVLREGSEVVLFIYGIAVSSNETVTAMT
ncbi:MAG: FTR1 family protein, partial [Burkholderiales bacterium]